MEEKRIVITAPMHVSSHGFAAGVATAMRAIRDLPSTATIGDVDNLMENLLAKANSNLTFNNSVVAHQHGFTPGSCTMRCRIDKDSQQLILTIRPTNK